MQNFEFSEHTADVRILLKGSGITELFSAGLSSINKVLYDDLVPAETDTPIHFEISSCDLTALLVDFLNHCLSLSYINNAVFSIIYLEINEEEFSLKASVSGMKVPNFNEDIKAVTYTEAEISKEKDNNYQCQIILDL